MNKTVNASLRKKRRRAETRFRFYGWLALATAVAALIILLGSIMIRGVPGFVQTQIRLTVTFDSTALAMVEGDTPDMVSPSSYQKLAQGVLKTTFPEVTEREELRELNGLISPASGIILKRIVERNPELISTTQEIWLPASSDVDQYVKKKQSQDTPEEQRRLSHTQAGWVDHFVAQDRTRKVYNEGFLTQGDSRTPEQAGFLGAMVGSALVVTICLLGVFPIGVMTAVYLEEFAPKNKWIDLIEVNINNLAAVPSIVFGLLGLAVYINFMGMPRSASLVGGLTLALMVLPVIIIATRVALKAVPDSIRDAARALGATPVQVVWHHTIRLAMPGIMTGTILSMARAIGETAPLLMIGMVAFVADTPSGFTSPATVMPVQIFLWAGSPEAGFAEKTATGILVLLVLLIAMNALAIFLRRRFEIRW